MFQSTCEGYKELGMKEDAYCRVDADGTGPLHEFKVLCNMTNSKDAVTIVNHTSSARQVKIMDEAYTFSYSARSWAHKLDYGVDFESLRALIDESDHCRQYVEFNCINTKFLTRRELELPGAYWVSENGVEHHYWGGGKLGGVTCACGTTLSCHDKTKTCNCDTGDGVWRQDAGMYCIVLLSDAIKQCIGCGLGVTIDYVLYRYWSYCTKFEKKGFKLKNIYISFQ